MSHDSDRSLSHVLQTLPTDEPAASVLARPDASLRAGREEYQPLVARNIERFVGLAKLPIGLAGPLTINGEHASGIFHVPLATTEGTLVASTCRGMKVLSEAGGVETRIFRRATIQRAPVFALESAGAAIQLAQQLEADWAWLAPVVASTTRHGRLCDVRCFPLGRTVHVRLSIDPGDAAGQNMVSVAAQAAAAAIVERHPSIERFWMEGGMSGEKVPSNLNILFGRGRGVVASAAIPAELIERHLRARPESLIELLGLYVTTSLMTGTKNSHASLINILPALFIATGQDVASVPESCTAYNQLSYDAEARELRWELVCPNLVVGTVGGGTALPTQRECLELLGCLGPGGADALAEICAATALANELSFWGAICANEWVSAHARRRSGAA